ncbi:hypothetical protein B7494_g7333 [Chlorociboria aeruginascens]|nr:hypothetical protein B7494_g7333 [Chlorociboria aeruginascens]
MRHTVSHTATTATKGIFQNIQKVSSSYGLLNTSLFPSGSRTVYPDSPILVRSLIMTTVVPKNVPLSAAWTSYDGWDYNGMKERRERFMTVDGRLNIAQMQLPRHPDSTGNANEYSELYSIDCEVATMRFLHENVTGVPFPRLYAYEGPGSQRAANVGVAYMLIEGFYGNTMQDVQFNICELPVRPSSYSSHTGAITGKLSTAVAEGLSDEGPFTETWDYSLLSWRPNPVNPLQNWWWLFHLDHRDMGMQNILVDQYFNFLTIIDWEFAPWEVIHYAMPFAPHLCRRKDRLHSTKPGPHSTPQPNELDRAASGIYAMLEKLGVFGGMEMVRLAYGFDREEAKKYLNEMEAKMKGQ